VLRNGITVIINEHHSTPIAALVAHFKASPLDEPWSLSARAKLVDRILLRGTLQRPGNRALSDLRALGASIQSNTAYDGAAYSIVIPSEKLKDALLTQADILQNPAFDNEAIQREIRMLTSIQRWNGGTFDLAPRRASDAFSTSNLSSTSVDQMLPEDDPPATARARLFTLAFTGATQLSPEYSSLTKEQLYAFYRAHYRPDNLIISIAGDVSTFNTLVAVQQLFGSFGVKLEPAPTTEAKGQTSVKSRGATRSPAVTSAPAQKTPSIEAPVNEPPQGIKP